MVESERLCKDPALFCGKIEDDFDYKGHGPDDCSGKVSVENDAELAAYHEDFGLDRLRWLDWFTGTGEPFEGQTAYIYPVFYRDKRWIEYFPFYPPPPNEVPRSPVGMPEIGSENM